MAEYCDLEPEERTRALVSSRESHINPSWPETSSVEFRNVTVRYTPDGADILKNISVKFDAGQRTAIVGRTGSGKTTVSQLYKIESVKNANSVDYFISSWLHACCVWHHSLRRARY